MALATPTIVEEGQSSKVRLQLPSSKLEALHELVSDNPGQKFVVFSSSKQVCYLAKSFFAERGITSHVLSGDTPSQARHEMVTRFQNDDAQIFFGVIEAAAEGIDGLQFAASTVVFLDRSWRTIKNRQAQDRLDRDGQLSGVQVIDVMARDTIDMGRHQRLEQKWFWIRQMLGDNVHDVK
jgi:SNF2 family DNA or RNA helicase